MLTLVIRSLVLIKLSYYFRQYSTWRNQQPNGHPHRPWWEQISEYIHLTYNRNLDEIMDQAINQMDLQTAYHSKGDTIWALGPKAKHEIMRGQWGRELKDVDLPELLKLFRKTFIPARKVLHS